MVIIYRFSVKGNREILFGDSSWWPTTEKHYRFTCIPLLRVNVRPKDKSIDRWNSDYGPITTGWDRQKSISTVGLEDPILRTHVPKGKASLKRPLKIRVLYWCHFSNIFSFAGRTTHVYTIIRFGLTNSRNQRSTGCIAKMPYAVRFTQATNRNENSQRFDHQTADTAYLKREEVIGSFVSSSPPIVNISVCFE